MRVIFFANSKTASFNVSIKEDNMIEDNESFRISIICDSLPYNITVGNCNTATINIVDSKYYYFII